tara:strand:- start:59 stop:286 length:228 start_codon:yes stop_codon:yes gene_type:complete
MNNERANFYKSLFLFEEEVQILVNGIITAQDYYGNQKNGTSSRDKFCNARIEELERVLDKLYTTHWKELPEPQEK